MRTSADDAQAPVQASTPKSGGSPPESRRTGPELRQNLQLPAGAIAGVMHASQRSSFALAAGSIQAVLPGAAGTRPVVWLSDVPARVIVTRSGGVSQAAR